MIKLSDFTSLFEVSIAIHLLYSLIPEVQRIFLAKTKLRYNYFLRSIPSCKRKEAWFIKEMDAALKSDNDNRVDANWDSMDKKEKDKIRARRVKHNMKEKEFKDIFRAIDLHTDTYNKELMTLDKIATEKQDKYIPIAFSVSVISLVLIIICGFFPKWEIHWTLMSLFILISILPMPLMVYLTYRRSKHFIKNAKEAIAKLDRVTFACAMGTFNELPNRGL